MAEWGTGTRTLCRRAHVAGSQRPRSPADVRWRLVSARRWHKGATGSPTGRGSRDKAQTTARGDSGEGSLTSLARRSERRRRKVARPEAAARPKLLLLPRRPARLPRGLALRGRWPPASPRLLIRLRHLPQGGYREVAGSSVPAGRRHRPPTTLHPWLRPSTPGSRSEATPRLPDRCLDRPTLKCAELGDSRLTGTRKARRPGRLRRPTPLI